MSIAATVGVPIITGIPACIHDGFVAVERLRGVNQMYLFYVLKWSESELRSAGQTGSQSNINTDIVNGLLINLPPEPEQERIAAALMDADKLIASLDRLIAKRQAIKQGVIQQLLTGNTRLPGFNADWRVWQMGSLGSTYGGLTSKAKDDFQVGEGRYIPFMAVMSGLRVTAASLLRVRVSPGERQNVVASGDLLFNTSSETPDELAMCAVASDLPANTYLNSFCFGFRLMNASTVDPLFLAYTFRSEIGRRLINVLAQGATRYNLAKSQFRKVVLILPSIDEQRAIAAVLNDADEVVATLTARLEKARAIKQGMMQELLTGHTRLPAEKGAA